MSYKRNNYKKYFFDRHSFKFIITRYWEDRCNKAKAMWKIILDDTTQDGMLIECFLETKKEAIELLDETTKDQIIEYIRNTYFTPLHKIYGAKKREMSKIKKSYLEKINSFKQLQEDK